MFRSAERWRLLCLLISQALIVIVIIGIEGLLVVLSGLDFASVAFFAEGKVEIVAFEADPVLGGIFRGLGERLSPF